MAEPTEQFAARLAGMTGSDRKTVRTILARLARGGIEPELLELATKHTSLPLLRLAFSNYLEKMTRFLRDIISSA
jgi:hypothetical protein